MVTGFGQDATLNKANWWQRDNQNPHRHQVD